ncbi:DNA methyltransferase, partial [Nostoc sp. NIES-2111]
MSDLDFNMDVIGFTTPEIDLVIHEAADKNQKAAEPEREDLLPGLPHGPVTSRLGDLWQLGKHRLICADATDEAAIARLMDGKQVRMVLTDPPYNVKIKGFVSGLGKVKHREFAMASGEMDDAAFREFLVKATKTAVAHLVDGGLLYGFIDWRGLAIYHAALTDCGLSQVNLAVWNKLTGGMGSLYRSQHELCVISKNGTAPHINQVQLGSNGRYRTNVWDHPGMASFGKGRDESLSMHPTVKPVGLLVEAIKDVTDIGDIVVDTFLGSGSTLIAAQKCHRVCYGSELDPIYADAIIRRFETLTGIEAVHIETGLTFAQMT